MKLISFDVSADKRKAYAELRKRFNVSTSTVSLAMSFKRDSLESARMRYIAVHEFGGKILSDEPVEITKAISQKGELCDVVL